MSVLVLAVALLPLADLTPKPTFHTGVIEAPHWIRRPTGPELAHVYPSRALEQGHEGRTVMNCVVTADGHLEECEVIEETPADEGFAKAALRLQGKYQMTARTADGAPVAGARIRIPIQWRLR